MTTVEQAQQTLAEARVALRTVEHEENVALNARDRVRNLLANTLEVQEHIKLTAELAKAESRAVILHRQYEVAKKHHDEAETEFRKERDVSEQRSYRLKNVIPEELRRLESAVEGEQFAVASALSKVSSSENLLAHVETYGPASKLFECKETVRQAKEALRLAKQRLADAEERLEQKKAHRENLLHQTAA